MIKKILNAFLVLIVVLSVTGFKSNQSTTINVTIEDKTSNVNIKVGDILTYLLANEEYSFKIIDISEKKVIIVVNKYGLSNRGNLLSKERTFIIEKNKKLKLHTQTTDYQEYIIFKY